MPRKKTRKKQQPVRFSIGRWRALGKLLLAFLIVPYPLTIIYWVLPPVSTPMMADVLLFKNVQRDWVSLDRMSPHLVAAVVSSEDSAFCEHFGVDFRQMEKSIEQANARNKPIKATSTITQQTAKNLYLWNGRSWLRKMLEAPIAFWMELVMSKRRILEIYLNIAQWGDGVYGAEAAARHHFGVSARDLSLYQASMLAASLPNPIQRNASRPSVSQILIAGTIQRRVMHGGPALGCVR